MRYTQAQINEISKAVVDALYKRQTIREAKEQIMDKECGSYRNFDIWVKDMRKRLNGERVHLSLTLNFAKVIHDLLRESDKAKLVSYLREEARYNKEHYGTPSIKMTEWLDLKEGKQ